MGIAIGAGVGANAANAPLDVAVIGGALVTVGPDNGGIFGVPMSIDGLTDAIRAFQVFQGMKAPDGRVDPAGNTIARLNAILFPDEVGITELVDGALATTVDSTTWAPVEASLVSDFVFEWAGVAGAGAMHYFQLNEHSVPRWFGVLVPEGALRYDRVHIFFHPTPAQAGHPDGEYHGLGSFRDVFHYLSDSFGSQFCASASDRILVMPLMTQAAAADCGIFPQRWANYLGCILGRLATGMSVGAPHLTISSVVVSSFSSGITYSHQFRTRTNLGPRLAGVIDFDGGFSSYSNLSQQLTGPAGHVVKAQQSAANNIPAQAAQNIFPLPRERWGGPWAASFDPNPQTARLQVHAGIPQAMMKIAAERAG
ncbi:hypothetical protein BST22_13920 [Mycolicibacterium chubuense]|uniref:Uncharacterized protein n=1 Tax=Mycolicibacterium chubuense TaxID=1800 RepID=A0A0J6WNF4_MYCCU|nr:peptidoglycan-binding domain-containing protein [Mycolicibacterium chubuense]KMO84109.1 hypothetical protein MCHUDSM44219_00914 [Mycolicibacterium chubuense]ORA51937.1 hypothetical protein BST22_13920 [Mycolicibacterium chubuense]SPX99867.1 Uncharacterised protein [Mycolicibacterium chubuense]